MPRAVLLPPSADLAKLAPQLVELDSTSPSGLGWRINLVSEVEIGILSAGYEVEGPVTLWARPRFTDRQITIALGESEDSLTVPELIVAVHSAERPKQEFFVGGGIQHLVAHCLQLFDGYSDSAPSQVLSIKIEHFVSDLLDELRQENSDLRAALAAAQIDVAFLQGQLLALREASAISRKSITKAILAGVGAILLAVTTGASEGIASNVVVPQDQSHPGVQVYIDQCEGIRQLLEG